MEFLFLNVLLTSNPKPKDISVFFDLMILYILMHKIMGSYMYPLQGNTGHPVSLAPAPVNISS